MGDETVKSEQSAEVLYFRLDRTIGLQAAVSDTTGGKRSINMGGSNEPCIRCGPDPLGGRCNFGGISWTVVKYMEYPA